MWYLGSVGCNVAQNLWNIGSVIQYFPQFNDIAPFVNSEIEPFVALGIYLERGIMFISERGTIPMIATASFDFLTVYS
jgi:hypothetical protein